MAAGEINSLDDLKARSELLHKKSAESVIVSICSGTGCKSAGADSVYKALFAEIEKQKLNFKRKIILRRTGCHGFCERGPIIIFYPQRYLSS
ncbi:MAG: (2Fe-2S) ferredoxin domain-containing protein [Actinomycetota bacterium]|nr:(2Fe-2S) ferredoxin domain-containing protein [Actinomycetota bacterium]